MDDGDDAKHEHASHTHTKNNKHTYLHPLIDRNTGGGGPGVGHVLPTFLFN